MKKNEDEQKLLAIYNSYECRKIKLATMLKKKYREGDNFGSSEIWSDGP